MPSSLTTGLTMRLAPRPAPTHADAPSANVERWRGIVAPPPPGKDSFRAQRGQNVVAGPARSYTRSPNTCFTLRIIVKVDT
jgi:hypothetical protein